jgi:hypothetical protein
MRLTNPVTGINGVYPDSTASAAIQNNRRIHGFLATYSNAASRAAARPATQAEIEADLGEFRLMANGKPLRRALVSELHKINALNGLAFRAGQVLVQFSDPKRRTPDGEEWGAFSAFGIPGITVEFDIKSTAVGPALSLDCEYDFVPDKNRGFIVWEKRTIVSPTAGDDYDLNDLIRAGAYSRIHLFTDKISRVRAQIDDADMHDRTPEKIAAFLAKHGLTVQAGTTPVVFDYTQQISDALDMTRLINGVATPVNSFNVKITHTAGVATYPVISERLVKDVAAQIA